MLWSLYELQLRTIQASPRLFCNATPMPVLDPRATSQPYLWLWAHAMDDRPWGKPSPPAVVCGRPGKCKQNITSERACGRVLTCVRPRDATSIRRGPYGMLD
ncbi:hypothetical protein [Bradyrhizobium sp. USDA 3315]